MAIDALRDRFEVTELCRRLGIHRSSYCYSKKASQRPDFHALLQPRIRSMFEKSGRTFGSECIWHSLKEGDDGDEPVRVSEKVIRRLMREEGLAVIYRKKKRVYSSCKGEISEHPGNLVQRDFHANAPNEFWLTGIIQFTLSSFKCYLSAVVGCFDGKAASHLLSKRPDAALANSALIQAIRMMNGKDRPVIHGDCGCHYRWSEWISSCEGNGVTRSSRRRPVLPASGVRGILRETQKRVLPLQRVGGCLLRGIQQKD